MIRLGNKVHNIILTRQFIAFGSVFFLKYLSHTQAPSPKTRAKKVFYKPSIAVNLLTTCRRNFLSTQNL